MGLGGYRNLRDANVWQRGINLYRMANRSPGSAAAHKLAARNSSRRRGAASATHKPEHGPTMTPSTGSSGRDLESASGGPCGAGDDIHLSIASRLDAAGRNQRKRLRFVGRASLDRAGRRSLRLWQRGAEFVRLALGVGRTLRRSLLAKLSTGNRGSRRATGRHPFGGWGQVGKQLQTQGTLSRGMSRFRSRQARRLSLRLLEKASQHGKSSSPQEMYRPPRRPQ